MSYIADILSINNVYLSGKRISRCHGAEGLENFMASIKKIDKLKSNKLTLKQTFFFEKISYDFLKVKKVIQDGHIVINLGNRLYKVYTLDGLNESGTKIECTEHYIYLENRTCYMIFKQVKLTPNELTEICKVDISNYDLSKLGINLASVLTYFEDDIECDELPEPLLNLMDDYTELVFAI